ncbi:translin [Ardenticatena maritima]|uniref:Translin n=1 Tax=Ardenticatena maritima TaxID=872965 RepID=A0A0M8K8C5_9CHLR|nr:hypothetical protein [Ardenticatena maritima]KPL87177.1 hypothetical protein SE16_11625 [Ardenticatena maritima]GAP62356.1 translin [Ardenticatena maritima]
MPTLDEIVAAIDARLEEKDATREQVLSLSRKVVQHASKAIRATHRREWDNAERLLDETGALVAQMNVAAARFPDIFFAGYTQDAQKEYGEARLTYAFVRDLPIPTPDDLGIEDAVYLNALGEAASELRRTILDLVRQDAFDEVHRLLACMEDVYSLLQTVDYPHAITNNVRRTNDMLRGVLDRTRGDVTTAFKQYELRHALAHFEKLVQSSVSKSLDE